VRRAAGFCGIFTSSSSARMFITSSGVSNARLVSALRHAASIIERRPQQTESPSVVPKRAFTNV